MDVVGGPPICGTPHLFSASRIQLDRPQTRPRARNHMGHPDTAFLRSGGGNGLEGRNGNQWNGYGLSRSPGSSNVVDL
jgi:hypothetical protein